MVDTLQYQQWTKFIHYDNIITTYLIGFFGYSENYFKLSTFFICKILNITKGGGHFRLATVDKIRAL